LNYLKRKDFKFNSTYGTNLNYGAQFLNATILPHGPNGIVVGHHVVVGTNCTIYQQVTIASGGVKIGDDVLIGAGAKILKNVVIGNNVKVGANAVVSENIPDNASLVL